MDASLVLIAVLLTGTFIFAIWQGYALAGELGRGDTKLKLDFKPSRKLPPKSEDKDEDEQP